MDRDLEFENDFMSDDDVDAVIDGLIDMMNHSSESVSIINPKRINELMNVYNVLKYATKNSNVTVSYEINKPYVGMGSVSIVGSDISFNNAKWFLAVARLASNFNVYPKTNGDVCMDFTFHGLTTEI